MQRERIRAGQPAKLLIVDDDPDVHSMLVDLLKPEGFRLSSAMTACDALVLLTHWRPDLVLLDLTLPDLDGQYVASRISACPDWFDIPVIAITGRTDDSNRSMAKLYGVSDYLTKPLDLMELLECIRRALGAKARRGA